MAFSEPAYKQVTFCPMFALFGSAVSGSEEFIFKTAKD